MKIFYIILLTLLIGGCEKNDSDPLSNSEKVANSEITKAQAFRILEQATFGPTDDDLKAVQTLGTAKWIEQQLNASSAYDSSSDSHQSHLQRYKAIAKMAEPSTYSSESDFNNNYHGRTSDYQTAAWFDNVLHGKDQLRQRVAFALSELIVISGSKQRTRFRGDSLASYYDILAKHAFGNFRNLMEEISRSPGMGVFLSHQGNKKFNSSSNTHPDENFARELMQLFSIGLWKMNQDGSMVKDSSGDPIASYTQDDVEELAKVMTGYDIKGNSKFGKTNRGNGEEWASPMEFNSSHHEYASKTFLGSNIGAEGSSNSDPADLDQALNIIFQHQNVGPHVGRHLITRLITSNPSSAYISRVAEKFNNDGNGNRGNLKEVVRSVLLDPEAREEEYSNVGNFGKPKEPLLALTQFLRAFDVKPLDGWKSRTNATMNGVYQFFYLENIIGQSPLRSETVFNFFSSDFIPADSHFISNSMVAPEFQIQSDTVLIKFHNLIRSSLNTNEKNAILENNASLKEFASARSYTKQNYYINVDIELQIFENALDGDTNGDFININDSEKKKAAIQTLLKHLDEKLMGGEMPSDYYTALTTHLMNMNWGKKYNAKEARNVISDAIRFMVISSFFMIQK